MQNSEIYQEIILDHARHPRNRGILEPADFEVKLNNPLCGDEMVLTLRLDQDRISECGSQVRGCTICQASSSMMSEQLTGKSTEDASQLSHMFQSAFKYEGNDSPLEIKDLMPLLIIKSHLSRVKCVILPWDALDLCLEQHKNNSSNSL
mgnify:CR=1 FL=1